MQRILGLDLDGTLADHTAAKVAFADMRSVTLTPHEALADTLAQRFESTEAYEEFKRVFYRDHAGASPLFPGVREALAQAIADGWELFVITAQTPESEPRARAWVDRELGDLIPEDHVLISDISGTKDALAAENGVRVFIDDRVRFLNQLASVPHTVLHDPMGQHDAVAHSHHRMSRWDDLTALLSRLEE